MQDNRPPEEKRSDTLQRYFAGITEYAFEAELGVADPPLVDYISELLIRFVRHDAIFNVRSIRGQRLTQVADMLAEATARRGVARRRLLRHIGDFTLFWTGVYPDVADKLRRSGGKDALLDYREQGKRTYLAASQLPEDDERAPCEVLQRLSDQFELCVYGLSEVRRLWQEGDPEGPPQLIV